MNKEKYKLLKKGLVLDLVGMLTMSIPVIGPFLDLLWAPYAAKQMVKMYKGTEGKVASVVVFLEEILPFTDVIPTFTLMWVYNFVYKKQPTPQTIEVRVDE